MRIYVTKSFERFRRKQRIGGAVLIETIERADLGLIDADLGEGLIKQRIARPGEGKRGGYRSVIAYRSNDRAVYLLGYAKNSLANIAADDLAHWRLIAADLLNATDDALEAAVSDNEITEVTND